jgi:hypothetical protein
MCFVDCKQSQAIFFVQSLEDRSHSIGLYTLWRNIQKYRCWDIWLVVFFDGLFGLSIDFRKQRRNDTFQDFLVLFFCLAAVDACGWNALGIEGFCLVFHESEQWRNDNGDTTQQARR